MKSTLLLATGLFLISAPAPDAQDVAEMTANFIVPRHVAGTLASDEQLERGDILRYPADAGDSVAAFNLQDTDQQVLASRPTG